MYPIFFTNTLIFDLFYFYVPMRSPLPDWMSDMSREPSGCFKGKLRKPGVPKSSNKIRNRLMPHTLFFINVPLSALKLD